MLFAKVGIKSCSYRGARECVSFVHYIDVTYKEYEMVSMEIRRGTGSLC